MSRNVTNKYSQAFLAGLDESTLSKLATKLQQNEISRKNEAYKFRRAISEFIRRTVSAWNMDEFITLEALAYVLTVEEFKLKQYSKLGEALRSINPDYYTLNFAREFYKEKSNTIAPYLNNYVTSGHLKIRLRRSKAQFPASTIDDFSSVVVSISDLKEWLSYAGRELPLIFSATKHFYPLWLKELLASQWITIPMLAATTPKVVEVEVLNQNPRTKKDILRKEILNAIQILCFDPLSLTNNQVSKLRKQCRENRSDLFTEPNPKTGYKGSFEDIYQDMKKDEILINIDAAKLKKQG